MDIWTPNSLAPPQALRAATLAAYIAFIAVNVASAVGLLGATNAGTPLAPGPLPARTHELAGHVIVDVLDAPAAARLPASTLPALTRTLPLLMQRCLPSSRCP